MINMVNIRIDNIIISSIHENNMVHHGFHNYCFHNHDVMKFMNHSEPLFIFIYSQMQLWQASIPLSLHPAKDVDASQCLSGCHGTMARWHGPMVKAAEGGRRPPILFLLLSN